MVYLLSFLYNLFVFMSDFNCLESKFVQESWQFCVAFCIESWLLTDIVTASIIDSYGSASHGR